MEIMNVSYMDRRAAAGDLSVRRPRVFGGKIIFTIPRRLTKVLSSSPVVEELKRTDAARMRAW